MTTHRLYLVVAMILFGQLATATAGWERYNLPAGGGSTHSHLACHDDSWNICWWQRGNELWGSWGSGANWNAQSFANNMATGRFGSMACDSVWHIVWYEGTDGFIWALYYDGSAWVNARIGTNLNTARHYCVDSNYHILWYVASDGSLWAIYYNGSAWVEAQIDPTARQTSGGGARISGCDSVRHWIWTVSSDNRTLLVTYLNGGAWTTAPIVTLPAGEKFGSVCANPSDGHCYQLIKDNGTNAALRVQQSRAAGGVFVEDTIWTECLPTNSSAFSQHLLPPHNQQYMCYLSRGLITGEATHPVPRHCAFGFGSRGWCSGWTHGRGILMCLSHNGRAMLCQDVNENTTTTNGTMFVLWNTDF